MIFLHFLQQPSSSMPRQSGHRLDPLEGGGDPVPRQRSGHRPRIVEEDFTMHKLYLHQGRGKFNAEQATVCVKNCDLHNQNINMIILFSC